jgi:hypothetical protein
MLHRNCHDKLLIILLLGLLLCTGLALADSITFSPLVIADPDEIHTISWQMSTKPDFGDAVVVYLVPDSTFVPVEDGPEKKAVGFFYPASEDPQGTGKGSVKLPIYLSRDMAFYFEYRRTVSSVTTVLAHSKLLVDSLAVKCSQFHLATTHINGQMLVQYTTSDDQKDNHIVQVDTSPDFSNSRFFQANDTKRTYSIADMYEKPATDPKFFFDPGRFREGLLTGLQPSLRYHYRIVNDQKKVLSKSFSFISAPYVGSPDSYTDLYIFGDLGVALPFFTTVQQQTPSAKTTTSIETQLAQNPNKHASLLLIGDLSYARGYSWLWEYFFRQIEPISSQIPFHVSIGNHEYDYLKQPWKPDWSDFKTDSGGEGGVPVFRRFTMPDDFHVTPYTPSSFYRDEETIAYAARKERGLAYSYNNGVVHIIVFSAEHNFTKGSAQWKFIERDLKSVDRKVTPWVIVTSHRPMYCTSTGCSIDPAQEDKKMDWRLRQELEALLVENRVHLYIAGHNHHYARSSMISGKYKTIDDDDVMKVVDGVTHYKYRAPVHVLTGAAGNPYEPPYQPFNPMVKDGSIPILHHVTPEWLQFRTMSFGYSNIKANYTHLTQTFYGNQHVGIIHDQFVMTEP